MSNTLNGDLNGVLQFVSDCRDSFWSSECEIRPSPVGGLGVFAKRDIEEGTTLLKLSKSCLFSASNSTIANLLVDEEIDGVLGLNIAFIYETTVFAHKSHWTAYLKSIRIYDEQQQLILPPSYWSVEVKNCLKGSALHTLHDGLRAEEEVQEGFELAVDLARKWNQEFGLEIPSGFFDVDVQDTQDTVTKFHRFVATAYAISSRIFEIDAHHENALVPIADLFNHSTTNPDVRFRSLYEVCPLCGEPGMCKHLVAEALLEAQENGDQDDVVGSSEESSDDEDDTSKEDEMVDITLANDVQRGQEIFNSYGELSNALLLARYGFTVADNPHDVVHLGREIKRLVGHHRRHTARAKWWRQTVAKRRPWLAEMYIDSQGEPSRNLSAFLNLLELTEPQWLQLRGKAHTGKTAVQELQTLGKLGTRAHLLRLIAYKRLSHRRAPQGIPATAKTLLDSENTILQRASAKARRQKS